MGVWVEWGGERAGTVRSQEENRRITQNAVTIIWAEMTTGTY